VIRSALGKVTFAALTGLVAAATTVGCSGDSSKSGRTPTSADQGKTGMVGLAIQVAPGIFVNQVHYVVTGNGQNVAGDIDVTDPNSTVSVQVGLPAGTAYNVVMSATATQGSQTPHCEGTVNFDIVAGTTTSVFVNLLCDALNNVSNIGGKIIEGQFTAGDSTTCPDVAFYTVSPLQTSTGSPITLNGAGTAGATTTVWTATPAGTITNPTAASTTFTCIQNGAHTLTFTVTDGKSCTDSQTINVNCIPPGVCGNGSLEAGEGCDDGNLVSGDGCSSACVHETVCGDGLIEAPETCDPPVTGFCSATCQNVPPLCGDGVVQSGETCDPPAAGTCDATCHTIAPIVCGNGIIEAGETCDPPAAGTCDATCHIIVPVPCGNGVLDPGEQCDPPGTAWCGAGCLLAGSSCTTCEDANCGSVVSDCTTAGSLCTAALECSRDNDCYNLDPAICYCGAVDIVACQGATGPAGPCITQYNAAASSPTPAQVLLDLTDPSTALGKAGFIQQCDNAFCPGCPN